MPAAPAGGALQGLCLQATSVLAGMMFGLALVLVAAAPAAAQLVTCKDPSGATISVPAHTAAALCTLPKASDAWVQATMRKFDAELASAAMDVQQAQDCSRRVTAWSARTADKSRRYTRTEAASQIGADCANLIYDSLDSDRR